MLIEFENCDVAFGMQWKPLLSKGSAHTQAREAKRSYLWTHEGEHYFGLLSEEDSKVRHKKPLYSGAIQIKKAYPDAINLLAVFAIDDKHFLICGLHQKRPRDGFDTVVAGAHEAGKVIDAFRVLCKGELFTLVGDANMQAMEAADLGNILTSHFSHDALLMKTKATNVKRVAMIVGVGVVLYGLILAGDQVYQRHKAANAEIAEKNKKTPQQRYSDALYAINTQPIWLFKDIGFYVDAVGELSHTIGGWLLSNAECTRAGDALNCDLTYERSASKLATNQSFVDDLDGVDLAKVDFGGDGRHIYVKKQISHLPVVQTGKVIDAAKTPKIETIEFGSKLQQLTNMGKQDVLAYLPFGVPAGVDVTQLQTPPVMSAKVEMNLPLRALKLADTFPGYVSVDAINLTVGKTPIGATNNSSLKVTLRGQVFAKPQ